MLGFEEVNKMIWNIIILLFDISTLPQHWVEELKCLTTQIGKGKWLGIFSNEEHPNLCKVFAIIQDF